MMNKTLLISGIVSLVAIYTIRISRYFQGYDFDKYWHVPMIILPIGMLALIVFIFFGVSSVIKSLIKSMQKHNLLYFASIVVFIVLAYLIPFPTYVDGMKKKMESEVSRGELFSFAEEARKVDLDWVDYQEHDKYIDALRSSHKSALSLGSLYPKISVDKEYVSVFYGSALVKHWGYVVGDIDEFPIDHIPENMIRKVYEGVWVYHDIW